MTDYGVALPTVPDDEEIDPGAYLNEVRDVIGTMPEWSVRPLGYVGRFSFAKLVMFREIDQMLEHYAGNSVISALATGSEIGDTIRLGDSVPEVTPDQLDDLPLSDVYDVLDADSSQIVAIRKVQNGSHLVIEGPPGTGKSQTISNMIATLMGMGKSVLFVSEKAAALEVVHGRLRDVGLEEFTLSIHSKPDRGVIVRDLRRCLDGGTLPSVGDESLIERVQARRE
ncbi:hypothetical protein B1A_20288, partial [mine drainage metagenome]